MKNTLRDVLTLIENAPAPLTVAQISQALEIEPGIVDGMIEHWIRKGKLRQTSSDHMNCHTCGGANGCPFIGKMPRSYELTAGEDRPTTCSCRQ